MNKMLIAAAASSVFLLAGCSSGPDEETMTKMNALNDQVSQLNQLNQEVQALEDEKATLTSEAQRAKSTAEAAQEEAARANERIDNIAQSYTK